MHQAHLVGVYTQEEVPEEVEGFVRYQAARDGHRAVPGERIAVLNVIGTARCPSRAAWYLTKP
ncbi:MAG TPA: DUF749 family protein, partial [Methanomassiliicoccales archaeon]|nr:DUF749 family protein [Methanomassiliicoccales archaeon]